MIIYCKRFIAPYFYLQYRTVSSTTIIVYKDNLPATAYKPDYVEKNKYSKWEKNNLFTAENKSDKPTFSMVLPPPNVTGKLHLGHALACTIQDVIARRKRSLGYNVLWLPGLDHAGIATQSVVEKYMQSKHINPKSLGRDKFNKEVWKWKEKYGNTIFDQLKTLGCSLDWSRETFTMDRKHTHAVNTAFITLFQKGLIYRKKALVNWCTALKSTVSDIEVDNLTVNGATDIKVPGYDKPVKFGLIYNFAYEIYDSIKERELVVSTTMPETMLGDVAIAVHPSDERYKHLIGKRAIHPFRRETIPIIGDHFVDMNFGTGAVKITPAHSKVDYEIGKKHHLPLLQVIDEDGFVKHCGIEFDNLKKYECRENIVKVLEELGLLRNVSPHQMSLPICSRTGDVIEYLPKEQWFLSCTKLNEKAEQLLRHGQFHIKPEKYVKNWHNWDDRDWCISRQLWWGHQIPAYKCSVGKDVIWIAATDVAKAKIKASRYLRTMPNEIIVERDTDVLDTWFSSAIYPFASLGWPDTSSADFIKFCPLTLMATGHDILGFWVHRMVALGLELTEKLPFNEVLLHGIICDSRGAKMSKSRGNVIDPLDVVNGISMEKLREKTDEMHKTGILSKEEHQKALSYHKVNFANTKGIPDCGVDALRFTLLTQDIKSNFVNFDIHICHANKLFCNKIWQSIKYMQQSFQKLKLTNEDITLDNLTNFDKWILSKLANMVEKVNESMDSYDFHIATNALRTFIYNEFCDVYLEATKPGFESGDVKMSYAHAHTLSAVLNTSLRCLAPFMIYVTEELIPKIPAFEKNIIYNFNDNEKRYLDFPLSDSFETWKDSEFEKHIEKLLNTINVVRQVKGFYGITNKVRPVICINTNDENLVKNIEDNKSIVLHFTRASDIQYREDAQKKYVTGFLNKYTNVNVEVIDEHPENLILAAKERLEKKVKKIEDSLRLLEERCSTAYYMENVPEWTKLLDQEKLMTKKQELSQLKRLI